MNGDGRPDGLRQLVNASYQPLISVSSTRSTSAQAARVKVPLGPPQRRRRTGPWSHLLSRPPAARRPRPARAGLAGSASHGMLPAGGRGAGAAGPRGPAGPPAGPPVASSVTVAATSPAATNCINPVDSWTLSPSPPASTI